ncbi:MAG: hypothetical protein J6T10_27975 [Methanobrevibacter sp.]|nr:hypothetical protein [Methanobrevibacter sp.]
MSKYTFLIWNYHWIKEDFSPLVYTIHRNQNQCVEEIELKRIAIACHQHVSSSDSPTNLVSLVLNKESEVDSNLPIPVDPSLLISVYTLNNPDLVYCNFYDLDGVYQHNLSKKIYLSPNDSLSIVLTPWTPPKQNVNAIVEYTVKCL